MNIVVYTTKACPKCTIVKGLLRARDLPFTEHLLSTDEEKAAFKAKYPNVRTVPFTLVDGKVIGDGSAFLHWFEAKFNR